MDFAKNFIRHSRLVMSLSARFPACLCHIESRPSIAAADHSPLRGERSSFELRQAWTTEVEHHVYGIS